jgi:hypothetical protein
VYRLVGDGHTGDVFDLLEFCFTWFADECDAYTFEGLFGEFLQRLNRY